MAQEDPHPGWIAVGQLMGAFGQQGEVRVKPLGGSPERFRTVKTVYLGDERTPADVLHRRRSPQGVILRLSTIASREMARDLFGTYLYLPETEAIRPPKGRYFVHQIVGLKVVTADGTPLGTVRDVIQTGSNDVYVVKERSREVLIPALKDVITKIDLDAGTMEVAPPPGLLD